MGGLNQTISQDACAADLAALGLTQAPRTFRSDSVVNYEIGVKARLFERRLSLNSAVFLIDWKDIRQTVALACGSAFTANIGAAKSKGFETELDLRLNEQWRLGVGVGYTDAYVTGVGRGSSSAEVGDKLSLVPTWNGGINLEFRTPLSTFDIYARSDATYVGERISTLTGTPLDVSDYQLVNLRAGFVQGSLDIAMFVDNVSNEIPEYGTAISLGADTPGRSRLYVGRPRTAGVEFRMSFR
jgi:iron complex outermembrane receptor protein